MLNSDVYWTTCEMDVTCDLLCWITTILDCMLVGLKSLVISLDYRSYMGSSAIIWSLRWLFLYLCSDNLDGSMTYHNISIISTKTRPGHSMHQVHPSKVKPLTLVDITKETGQGKEYLHNSSITTTHVGFNAPIAPTYHLSHREASWQTPIHQPQHQPTITSHNKAYM
jgi:hypothetical protein